MLILIAILISVIVLLALRLGSGVVLPCFCALIPFPISIMGGGESALNISPADCLMAVLAVCMVLHAAERGRLLTGSVIVPLGLFLLVSVVSSILYGGGKDTAVSLGRMVLGTAVALLIFANAEGGLLTARRSLFGYLVGVNVLSVCSVASLLIGGFRASQYTLGINKNGLGPIFGSGVVIALANLLLEKEPRAALRTWLLLSLAGATVGLILCLSRGGWIATGVGLAFLLFSTGRTLAFAAGLFLILGLVVVVWYVLPQEATDYATDVSPDTYVIRSRFDAMDDAMTAFKSSPVFGVGVGLRKRIEPHNVLVLTLGETGIAGLLTFLLAFGAAFYTLAKAVRATDGYTIPHEIAVAGMAVLVVTSVHGLMDVYWRRGVGILGWACVGMAVQILATRPNVSRAVPRKLQARKDRKRGFAAGAGT